MNELVGVISEDCISECISNIFTEAYKMARAFSGVRGEGSFIHMVVDTFIPMEMKENTDVLCDASEDSEWNSIVKRQAGGVV